MQPNAILKTSLLDLVFEDRNKAYGAYNLRQKYAQRLLLATSIMLVLAGSLSTFFLKAVHKAKESLPPLIDEVLVRTVTIPTPQPTEPPKPAASRSSKVTAPPTASFPVRIAVAPKLSLPIPETAELPAETGAGVVTTSSSQGSTDAGLSNIVAAPPAPALPPVAPDLEPEFPGGAAAWSAFLSRYLQSPQELEAGEKITVRVRFNVSETGAVREAQVITSGGAAFDAEVLRVLRKMPNWKPARHNGVAVAQWFTQPVTFIAMGE